MFTEIAAKNPTDSKVLKFDAKTKLDSRVFLINGFLDKNLREKNVGEFAANSAQK